MFLRSFLPRGKSSRLSTTTEMLNNLTWPKRTLCFLVPLLCLYSWLYFDQETIPRVCKNAGSIQGLKKQQRIRCSEKPEGRMGSVPPTFLSSVCKPTLRMWMSKNKTKTTTKNCSCLKKDWVITGRGCNAGIRIRCVEGIPRVWGHGDHLSHSGEATEG